MGFFKKNRWVFRRKYWIFSGSLKVANLPLIATKLVKFLKTFKNWVFFWKNRWVFRKKILIFFKIAKGSKLAVKCDWNSKNSKNVQKLGFFKKTIDGLFEKKNLVSSNSLKVANLRWNATEIVKFLKTFKIWVFKKTYGFFRKK